MKKLTQKERDSYRNILLKLCVTYGIEPFPMLFENLDERILENREKVAFGRKLGRKCGKALSLQIDEIIIQAIRDRRTWRCEWK